MKRDVKVFCQQCDTCQKTKKPTQKPAGEPHNMPIEGLPWRNHIIDILGPLPTSNGYSNIIVNMCRFTAATYLIPIPREATAKDIFDALLTHVWPYTGIPKSILMDQDPRWTGNFWASAARNFSIDLIFSTAYHHNTLGQVERTIQKVKEMLRAVINPKQDNWHHHLPQITLALNNRPVAWCDLSPLQLMYGHETNIEFQNHDDLIDISVPAVEDYLQEKLDAYQDAKDTLAHTRALINARTRNRRNAKITFNIGDWVLLRRLNQATGVSDKLLDTYEGPYRILSTQDAGFATNYQLALPLNDRRHSFFPADRLKHYKGDPKNPTFHRGPTDPDLDDDALNEYEVEAIIDQRRRNESTEYHVRWKGYDETEDTWETISSLKNAKDLLAEYLNHTRRHHRRNGNLTTRRQHRRSHRLNNLSE